MITAPIPYEFNQHPIRVLDYDGEPWFVAADAIAVLGIGQTYDAVRGLDEDQKGTDTIRTPGGDQQLSIVSESGLYMLVFRSRKPEAHAFRRWIASDVLPQIREFGKYEMADPSWEQLEDTPSRDFVPMSQAVIYIFQGWGRSWTVGQFRELLRIANVFRENGERRSQWMRALHLLPPEHQDGSSPKRHKVNAGYLGALVNRIDDTRRDLERVGVQLSLEFPDPRALTEDDE